MSNMGLNNSETKGENLLVNEMGQSLKHIQEDHLQELEQVALNMMQPPFANSYSQNPYEMTNQTYYLLRIPTGGVSQILRERDLTMSCFMYEVTGILGGIGLINPYRPTGPGNEMIFYVRDIYNPNDVLQVIQPNQLYMHMPIGLHVGQTIRCLGRVLNHRTILLVKISIITSCSVLHYGRLEYVSQRVPPPLPPFPNNYKY